MLSSLGLTSLSELADKATKARAAAAGLIATLCL